MMKKLSKITLLAAATAFLLAGVTACFTSTSDVDENIIQDSDDTGSGSGSGSGTGTTATAATYNFVGLSAADFAGGTVGAEDKGYWPLTGTFTMGGTATGAIVYSKGNGNARAGVSNGVTTKINFNGDGLSNSAVGTNVDISTSSRYVSIPVPAAGTVTVNCQGSSGDTLGKVVITDADGKVIKAETVTASAADYTADFTAAGTAYVTYSREGQKGGGLHVYSVSYEPK